MKLPGAVEICKYRSMPDARSSLAAGREACLPITWDDEEMFELVTAYFTYWAHNR